MKPIEPHPVRAVFDANVLLQAMARPNGPAGACLQAVREQRILHFASHELLAELLDVATRPSIIEKLGLTDAGTGGFLAELQALSVMIDPVPAAYTHPVDPKDTKIVNLAIAAGAHVITSRDRHLLSLRDANTAAGADFISRFASIEVLTPVGLLERLRAN